MKRLSVFVLLSVIFAGCAGKTMLSPETQKWLKDYETVVDRYISEIHQNPQAKPSKEVTEELERLQKDSSKLKAHLKTREGIPFVKEFTRITLKIARAKAIQERALAKEKGL